jgi:hypothetical protein
MTTATMKTFGPVDERSAALRKCRQHATARDSVVQFKVARRRREAAVSARSACSTSASSAAVGRQYIGVVRTTVVHQTLNLAIRVRVPGDAPTL